MIHMTCYHKFYDTFNILPTSKFMMSCIFSRNFTFNNGSNIADIKSVLDDKSNSVGEHIFEQICLSKLTPQELDILDEYLLVLYKLDSVGEYMIDELFPITREYINCFDEIITTKEYKAKLKLCLSFFGSNVTIKVVENYKLANDYKVIERYDEIMQGFNTLYSSYNTVFLYTNMICLLNPIGSPETFKLPWGGKSWYQAVTGSKMDFILSDIDNLKFVGKWFPLTKDLGLFLARILLQFRGSMNIDIHTLNENLYRAARSTISKSMIKPYLDSGMEFKKAKEKVNSIIDAKDYPDIYKLSTSMLYTLVNWSNRTGYVQFKTINGVMQVFISKLESEMDIQKILSLGKSITLPSFVEVKSPKYLTVDDIYINEATNIRYKRFKLLGDNVDNCIDYLQSIGWKISSSGLFYFNENFEKILTQNIVNINYYTDTLLAAILYNAIDKPFYYRCTYCHRGRIYYMCTSLSPQSNQFSQSLLTFSNFIENNSEIISQSNIATSISTSLFGKTYNDDDLYEMYSKTLKITYFDDPVNYVNKIDFDSGENDVAIRKDLASSYLQIIGIMFEDDELLKMSNMIGSTPVDWGSDIAKKLSDEIGINVTRSDVKLTVMKIVYGSNVAMVSREMPVEKKGIPKMIIKELYMIMQRIKLYRSSISTMICLNIDMNLLTRDGYENPISDFKLIEESVSGINASVKRNDDRLYEIVDNDKFNESISIFKDQIFKINDIHKIIKYLSDIQNIIKRVNYFEVEHYEVNHNVSMPVKSHVIKTFRQTLLVRNNEGNKELKRMEFNNPRVLDDIDINRTHMCMFANTIHSYDGAINAEIVIWFRKRYQNIASIHDCWMCEPKSAGELNKIVFESMKTVIPKTKRLVTVAPTNFLRY